MIIGKREPNGFEQITVVTTATAINPPAGSNQAVIQVEAQAVRYRDDGTNPTALIGMNIAVGGEITYIGDLNAIKFIETVIGAILNISYYK